MRTGISFTVSPADRRRLEGAIRDRNAAQKHVWRAAIILLSADGVGTHEIMRRTGKSKTCVWRWQERFMEEGVDGLLRDKTRPSRIPPLGPEVVERVAVLTLTDPPVEATHWTALMMAVAVGISESAVRRVAMVCSRTAIGGSSSRTILTSSANCAMSLGFTSILPLTPSSCPSMRKARSRRWTAPNRDCP